MKKLYDGVQRFCAAHPRFGIPNLMRVIVIGNVAVVCAVLLTQANDANAPELPDLQPQRPAPRRGVAAGDLRVRAAPTPVPLPC